MCVRRMYIYERLVRWGGIGGGVGTYVAHSRVR